MSSSSPLPGDPPATLHTHRSTERDRGARGRAFGAAMAAAVEHTVRSYRRLFEVWSGLDPSAVRTRGAQVAVALEAIWPEGVEEIAGIAAGAGQDELELIAINARTELFAGAVRPECSVVGVLPRASAAGTTLMAQNWDWHPDLARSLVVWTVDAGEGASFTTLTEAGILAKIGLNDRGLGCCLNMLASDRDDGAGGIPIHLLLRHVLERCTTVDEATALLLAAPVTASSAITVASHGAGGDDAMIATVELSPAGSRRLDPDARGVIAHANHFVHDDLRAHDVAVVVWPETLERQREVCAHLAVEPPGLGAQAIEALLRSHANAPDAVCRHDDASKRYDERAATLASIVLDLGTRRVRIAPGTPCTHAYRDWASL
jgi:isopenicillin-N N-acyltransferase-like protein